MNLLKNAQGFGLIEVMVGIAISAGLALTVMNISQQGLKNESMISSRSEINSWQSQIASYMGDDQLCSDNLAHVFGNVTFNQTPIPDTNGNPMLAQEVLRKTFIDGSGALQNREPLLTVNQVLLNGKVLIGSIEYILRDITTPTDPAISWNRQAELDFVISYIVCNDGGPVKRREDPTILCPPAKQQKLKKMITRKVGMTVDSSLRLVRRDLWLKDPSANMAMKKFDTKAIRCLRENFGKDLEKDLCRMEALINAQTGKPGPTTCGWTVAFSTITEETFAAGSKTIVIDTNAVAGTLRLRMVGGGGGGGGSSAEKGGGGGQAGLSVQEMLPASIIGNSCTMISGSGGGGGGIKEEGSAGIDSQFYCTGLPTLRAARGLGGCQMCASEEGHNGASSLLGLGGNGGSKARSGSPASAGGGGGGAGENREKGGAGGFGKIIVDYRRATVTDLNGDPVQLNQ